MKIRVKELESMAFFVKVKIRVDKLERMVFCALVDGSEFALSIIPVSSLHLIASGALQHSLVLALKCLGHPTYIWCRQQRNGVSSQ